MSSLATCYNNYVLYLKFLCVLFFSFSTWAKGVFPWEDKSANSRIEGACKEDTFENWRGRKFYEYFRKENEKKASRLAFERQKFSRDYHNFLLDFSEKIPLLSRFVSIP